MTYPPPPPGGYPPPSGYPGPHAGAPGYGAPYVAFTPKRPTDVFGRRVGAFAIDFGIIAIAALVMFMALAARETHSSASRAEAVCDRINDIGDEFCVAADVETFVLTYAKVGVIGLTALGYLVIHNVLVQGLTGATIGKAIVGIRCVRASDGKRCGIPRAALRTLLLLFPDGPFTCGIVGLVVAAATDNHRRIGDMAAGTAVVGKGSVGQPAFTPAPAFGYPAYPYPSYSPYGAPPIPASPVPPGQWVAPPPAAPAPPSPQPEPAQPVGGAPTMVWPTIESREPASEATSVFTAAPTEALPAVDVATTAAPTRPAREPEPKRPGIDEPTWDANRNTYIQWDPELNKWMQWNNTAQRWDAIV